MATTIDAVFVVDCTSSMFPSWKKIRAQITLLSNKIRLLPPGNVRLGLVLYRSYSAQQITVIHNFTPSMDQFNKWIDQVECNDDASEESKAISHGLSATLQLNWREDNDPNHSHEKLVILIADTRPCCLYNKKCPCGSVDPWVFMNVFVKEGIVLTVVGVDPCTAICDHFYTALSLKTGGRYIPLINAARVLSFVITEVSSKADTIPQLFRHLNVHDAFELNSDYNYSEIFPHVDYMIKNCKSITEIQRDMPFYRPQQENSYSYENGNGNGDIDIFVNLSTPTTDDEGYRSRLQSMASSAPVSPNLALSFASDRGYFEIYGEFG